MREHLSPQDNLVLSENFFDSTPDLAQVRQGLAQIIIDNFSNSGQ